MLWLCMAIRVLVNPLSNVFQKLLVGRGMSPSVVVGVTHGLLALVSLPLLAIEPPPGTPEFWGSMTVCAVLAVASNALLVKALRMSDLSILGPVNSYKAVVSLIPGIVLLNEVPSVAALAGVALIVAGSYFLADKDQTAKGERGAFSRLFGNRGVQYRIAALVLSAVEAVFLKRALLASSAFPTFAIWSLLGFILLLPFIARLVAANGVSKQGNSQVAPTCLLLAITTGLMQFTTIVIFGGFQVAAALALFQTSTLVSVLLGWRVFREPDIVQRFAGSAIMAAGAVLIVMKR